MQFRITSPSGDYSDWASGDGDAHMEHNTTENGKFELGKSNEGIVQAPMKFVCILVVL